MSIETRIQVAVARADLFICAALRWLAIIVGLAIALAVCVMIVKKWADWPALRGAAIIAALTIMLLAGVILFRDWAYTHWDPYLIDYDAPGVDITSEGP